MSPIAIMPETGQPTVPSPKVLPTDIPRRPSPWHEIAHSLSTTSLPPYIPRRASSSAASITEPYTPSSDTPLGGTSTGAGTPPLVSTSHALREWEEKLSHPRSDVSRHQLIDERWKKTKLAAERDKGGFIEYKLKLIDPTPERFERLITQLMWRLKQGRNEAIYELGLADDGTVIGLPRSQMDASLRTLELMASEVGATVIILREIVLHPNHIISPNSLNKDNAECSIKPKCTTNTKQKEQSRRRNKYTPKDPGAYGGTRPKKMIFDPVDHSTPSDSEEEFDDDGYLDDNRNRSSESEDSPFFLEAECELDSEIVNHEAAPHAKAPTSTLRSKSYSPGRGDHKQSSHVSKKEEKKRRKSAARAEARRLDLLRGDGTNPMWNELSMKDPESTEPKESGRRWHVEDANANGDAVHSPRFTLPHQPIRPSTLRLATPATSTEDADSFLDDLLHIPLDNLSLSFADVRSIPEDVDQDPQFSLSSSSSSSSVSLLSTSVETFISPLDRLVDKQGLTEPSTIGASTAETVQAQGQGEGEVEEMICVEALVVRKLQHDEDGGPATGEEDDEDEEEEWGYGGEEDVWGFGVDE
ncbi:uncharacterized protein I303_108706 [Kwoniella dejecticola CBS 10117]|uniref:GTP binding protein 2 n=1 Tax=Kwoniella dejecticola CBS 10117 TaxID=1296121 RepID=A0A1A5ZWM8_9TREE|nr:uncharacterized protein I303_06969 [Kwoniella dejecticola CBS 10117]OBR82210.1 hypothetical protein I303_06969 [Kwoniella dejecticola CBS 10117]